MTDSIPDIIDHLAGIVPGSKGERLRARRPVTKDGAQASHLALFSPADASHVSLAERHAVATFVARLHQAGEVGGLHAEKLAALEGGSALLAALDAVATAGAGRGPYGHYPAGPLSAEDVAGPVLVIGEAERAVLGPRLAAALSHAHLLVFHLRDAKPADLARLLDAGWSTTGVVTLSQLISFLAFQIRVVAGLKVLTAA